MTLVAENVIVAQAGTLWVAPLDTAAPTAVDSVLDAAFEDVGYLSEQGFSLTPNETVTKLAAWQNGVTVRVIRRGQDITVAFEMLEGRSKAAQETYWGDGATVSSDGLNVSVSELSGSTAIALVLDIDDGDTGSRIYLPKATLSERGTITMLSTDVAKMPVTFEGTKHDGIFCEIWHTDESGS